MRPGDQYDSLGEGKRALLHPDLCSSGERRPPCIGGTHGSMLGVLCLIGVVIQSDEVETRLHLVAPASKHVLPAHALPRVGVTAGKL